MALDVDVKSSRRRQIYGTGTAWLGHHPCERGRGRGSASGRGRGGGHPDLIDGRVWLEEVEH